MEKVVIGKCIDYTHDGKGVIKIDKMPIFVSNVMVGEEARVLITKKEQGYYIGKRLELITVSSARCKPVCRYFRECGGCDLQHMTYEEQLKFKTNRVQEVLKRIGGVAAEVQPCLGMEKPYFYRNKVQVPFGYDKDEHLVAGFFKKTTHEIVDIEKCCIEDNDGDKVVLLLKDLFNKYHVKPYDINKDVGTVRTVLVRKSALNRDLMVVITTRSDRLQHSTDIVEELVRKYPRVKTVVQNINKIHTSILMGDTNIVLYGMGYIEDSILGVRFKISPLSFYQVNPKQTEVLYQKAIEFANLSKEDVVLDAYCGVGTIGLCLANKVQKVVGVEIVRDAIKDAQENARLNQIKNAEFICADAKDYIQKAEKTGTKFDVVMMDPPRNGCDPEFIASLLKVRPQKIVYVSCEPSSLARDIKLLSEAYEVKQVQPVDMFPQTYHVETVVSLSQRKSDEKIKVEVDGDALPVTKAESKATYEDIQKYIFDKYGLKVTSLDISRVKTKCGIKERKNYNLSKSNNYKQPGITDEKEEQILDALRLFKMV